MDFFEHQDRARRQTWKLVGLFMLAVLGVVAVINLVVVAGLEWSRPTPDVRPLTSGDTIRDYAEVIFWTSLFAGGVVLVASLFRSAALRQGGARVARELGGTPVEPDTRDPLRRRYRNVVEEMAIASGVPVPQIFVLEEEAGINAFAAGYSTSDAAIAVTRGALEKLNREELQGVVAHEFSHIVNGDMRLNIRLIGLLFGILVLALIGRRMLISMRFSRGNRNAGAIMALALAVMLAGYIGLFFARWIRAAVSRRREYLADASAVQFTRQPEGIAGALKKIGASQYGSRVRTDSEEVGHMLFGQSGMASLFATHPPLEKRIRAIDPNFTEADLEAAREEMDRHNQAEKARQEEAEGDGESRHPPRSKLHPERILENIGEPRLGQILAAALIIRSLPGPLEQAAHSDEWAPELVCYLLLSRRDEVRARQLDIIHEHLGPESERAVKTLLQAGHELDTRQRLPLLEMAFPALRRRPPEELEAFPGLLQRLIAADGKISVFEYALVRLTQLHLREAAQPNRASGSGRRKIEKSAGAVRDLLGIVALHGHDEPQEARAALNAGLESLGLSSTDAELVEKGWPARLDAALEQLDGLKMKEKGRLVRALVRCVTHAGQVEPEEAELLRVICAVMHVPLPALDGGDEDG